MSKRTIFLMKYFFINCCLITNIFAHEICTLASTGVPGKCVLIIHCPILLSQLRNNIHPQACENGLMCCPEVEIVESRIFPLGQPKKQSEKIVESNEPLVRKSAKKCKEYEKYLYKYIVDQVALYDPPTHKLDTCTNAFTSIIGGVNAEKDEFPHMALVRWTTYPTRRCAGSIISENFILTAAHCIETEEEPNYVLVGVSKVSLASTDPNVQRLTIEECIQPTANRTSKYNDIALLKLSSKINFSPSVRPACLFTKESPAVSKFISSGWGVTEFLGRYSDHLKKVQLNLYPQDICHSNWTTLNKPEIPNGIVDSQLCANSPDGNDTCQGDSGGPLQIRSTRCVYHIVGITSFGNACGTSFPAVYTRVSSFIQWIEDTVWPN